ncbi:hypothetical protein Pcinc_031221, partial [Petrolisthes cinctipes]
VAGDAQVFRETPSSVQCTLVYNITPFSTSFPIILILKSSIPSPSSPFSSPPSLPHSQAIHPFPIIPILKPSIPSPSSPFSSPPSLPHHPHSQVLHPFPIIPILKPSIPSPPSPFSSPASILPHLPSPSSRLSLLSGLTIICSHPHYLPPLSSMEHLATLVFTFSGRSLLGFLGAPVHVMEPEGGHKRDSN